MYKVLTQNINLILNVFDCVNLVSLISLLIHEAIIVLISDPQPTVTVLIRGGFGRHAWTLQLRHLPRHRSGTKYQHTPNPGRPVPMEDLPPRPHQKQRYFPESVERIPQCKA